MAEAGPWSAPWFTLFSPALAVPSGVSSGQQHLLLEHLLSATELCRSSFTFYSSSKRLTKLLQSQTATGQQGETGLRMADVKAKVIYPLSACLRTVTHKAQSKSWVDGNVRERQAEGW